MGKASKGYRGFPSKQAYHDYYSDPAKYAAEIPMMEQYTRESVEERVADIEKAVMELFLANEALAAIEYDGTEATDKKNEAAGERLMAAEDALLEMGRALVGHKQHD